RAVSERTATGPEDRGSSPTFELNSVQAVLGLERGRLGVERRGPVLEDAGPRAHAGQAIGVLALDGLLDRSHHGEAVAEKGLELLVVADAGRRGLELAELDQAVLGTPDDRVESGGVAAERR